MSVSVIMAAYNVEACIERAIASLREQTSPPKEVIVCDDASTDGTRDVVRRLQRDWPAIRLLESAQNGGPSRARNRAIDAANGDWVAIVDADDWLKPRRLEKLEKLGEDTGADIVADNMILYDGVAEKEVRLGFHVDWDIKSVSLEDYLKAAIPEAEEFNYGLLQPLIRRTFLAEANFRYDENIKYGEDVQLYAELMFNNASMWLSSEPMYVYTTQVGEVSKQVNANSKSIPRYDILAEANDSLALKYAKKTNATIRRVLRRRGARLRAIYNADIARVYRKSGQFGKYAFCVLSHPRLLHLLLLRTGKRTAALVGSRPAQ